jgi:hypothetical protein
MLCREYNSGGFIPATMSLAMQSLAMACLRKESVDNQVFMMIWESQKVVPSGPYNINFSYEIFFGQDQENIFVVRSCCVNVDSSLPKYLV